jgi:hypothetical protein
MDTRCEIHVLKEKMMIVQLKWENIYSSEHGDEVSWFQENYGVSLIFIEKQSLKN